MTTVNLKIMDVVPFQTCPKCNGQGSVSRPPWVAGDVAEWSSSDCVNYTCDVCNGQKIIPMHVTSEVSNKVIEMHINSRKIDEIEKAACEVWNVPEGLLYSKSRKPDIVAARKAVMFYRRRMNKESFESIGSDYGKDHATVLGHVRRLPGLAKFDKELRSKMETFLTMLDCPIDELREK